MSELETKILTVMQSGEPRAQRELIRAVEPAEESEVKQVIRALLNRGELKLTIDWKLRAPQQSSATE